MAVAKEYLFEELSQTIGKLGKALGHSARVDIIAYLLDNELASYSEILSIIPLCRTTVNKHLRILEQVNLLQRGTMECGLAGFSLNQDVFNGYLNATRIKFKTTSRLRQLEGQLVLREVGREY